MKLKEWEWQDSCDAHMLKAAGVYAILDEDNEVMYVGQTDSFIRRWGEHCGILRNRTVPITEIFQFVVLEYEDNSKKRLLLEKEYWNKLRPKYGTRSSRTGQVDPSRMRFLNEYLKLNKIKKQTHNAPYLPDQEDDAIQKDEVERLTGWNRFDEEA